jgi:tRNA (guanine37-N1)-methyltransferase
MLRIDVVTIFPGLFDAFRSTGVLGGAVERGALSVEAHDLRRFTKDRHRTVDDIPYGGGPGMVMKPEPLVEAIEALAGVKGPERGTRVVLMTPQGRRFDGEHAKRLAREEKLLLVCGRYEGVDQRVIELAVDEELSIGDYVLSGGEVAAMGVIEAVSRFVPGVLGNPEGPQYTRPVEFRGLEVPEILRSGDHGRIAAWRRERAIERTRSRRPDLLTEERER